MTMFVLLILQEKSDFVGFRTTWKHIHIQIPSARCLLDQLYLLVLVLQFTIIFLTDFMIQFCSNVSYFAHKNNLFQIKSKSSAHNLTPYQFSTLFSILPFIYVIFSIYHRRPTRKYSNKMMAPIKYFKTQVQMRKLMTSNQKDQSTSIIMNWLFEFTFFA